MKKTALDKKRGEVLMAHRAENREERRIKAKAEVDRVRKQARDAVGRRARQLAEHALPESGARYDRTVDSHMSRIRNKLGDDAAGHIKTVWGVGDKFEPPRASE